MCGQPARLLLGRAVREQRRPDEVDADAADELRGAGAGELLGDDVVLDRAAAAAAVLLGPRDADERPLASFACHARPNATSSARSSKRGGRPLPYSHGRFARSQARTSSRSAASAGVARRSMARRNYR